MPKTTHLWAAILLAACIALLPTSLKANTLTPGGDGPADPFLLGYSGCPGPTGSSPCGPTRTILVASLPFGSSWGSGSFSGTAYEQVESDPLNPFCAGCLDFLFQVSLDSSSNQNITRVTESGFGNYQVDVGYDTVSVGSFVLCGIDDGGFCNSGLPGTVPGTVDRSSDGKIVGFNFPGVTPGDSTVDIVIMTNATTFTDPLATVFGANGASGTIDIYGPSGPPVGSVPEPSSLLLLASGMLGILGCAKRK